MAKPDVLAGLDPEARIKREIADIALLLHQRITRSDSPEDLALVKQITGRDISDVPIAVDPTVVVCQRCDADHPVVIPNNLFGQCDECGCQIQYRPKLPDRLEHICICCAARRIREDRAKV